MAKFQVGERVKITHKLRVDGIGWAGDMDQYIGTEQIIAAYEGGLEVPCYRIAADPNWLFPEGCVEAVQCQADVYCFDPGAIEREDRPETEAERRYQEKLEFRRAIRRIS